ncbi:hypothetical protein BT63DRAFT_408243 [Microthyrium microscopicum]|uniref:SWI5-dependent HO expression protein 3 n=1 Tax=Microthyrium microscopicum TaxID=703497 RepID=A0A6A6USG5_9PEZI|nr:hypothetical protein BT63DRAFT_408243 [Microthyrium microscopicum]
MRRASPSPFPASYQSSSSPWQNGSPSTSSANPTATGKTSQVIERLTAENDRLRRELNAEKASKEELVQQQRVLKAMLDALETKNNDLQHQFHTHDGALARKERRLDDLKASLEQEVLRRKRAEDREAEMGRKLDEVAADASREVAQFKNTAKAADTAYLTVQKEYLGLRSKLDTVQTGFREFVTTEGQKRKDTETKLVQLEILLDQKRQAVEQADKTNREQAALLEQFKSEFVEIHERKEEMIEATNQMRWVMGLQRARTENQEPQPD